MSAASVIGCSLLGISKRLVVQKNAGLAAFSGAVERAFLAMGWYPYTHNFSCLFSGKSG
jgi:hypothetical protein